MKIALVNYEKQYGTDAILSKYARMMERELIDLGHDVTITEKPDYTADVNHHINFVAYDGKGTGMNTTMITHLSGDKAITEAQKIQMVKDQEKTAYGICMNQDLKDTLVKAGCDAKKLFVSGHAHDSIPRRPLIIAMITNVYPDGRKREEMFTKLVKQLPDKTQYIFRIMGKNWMPILEPLRKSKIQVQYMDKFMADLYQQFLCTSDYLLYTGDEDSLAQSVIDAKQAGLRIIAPPQKEIEVEYKFNNQEELNEIFRKLVENPVKSWTWENFTKKHLEVWER